MVKDNSKTEEQTGGLIRKKVLGFDHLVNIDGNRYITVKDIVDELERERASTESWGALAKKTEPVVGTKDIIKDLLHYRKSE